MNLGNEPEKPKMEAENSDKEIEDDEDDLSYDEEKAQQVNQSFILEKKLKYDMELRNEEELDFEDEAEYPPNILVKDRFSKY